jgi:hypothetical protein
MNESLSHDEISLLNSTTMRTNNAVCRYHRRMEEWPPGGILTRDVVRSVTTLNELLVLAEAKALLETIFFGWGAGSDGFTDTSAGAFDSPMFLVSTTFSFST